MTTEKEQVNELELQKTCVDFHQIHFETIMDLIIRNPEYLTPSVLRAEVMQETSTQIFRKLIPRRNRHLVAWQKITILDSDKVVIYKNQAYKTEKFEKFAVIEDLPYYYPRFASFQYEYWKIEKCFRISALPFAIDSDMTTVPTTTPTNSEVITLPNSFDGVFWSKIFKRLVKMCNGTMNGYEKRTHHDIVVPKIPYQDRYAVMKEKYMNWVSDWKEATDPSKHVFEDIGIATFLILLWEMDENPVNPSREFHFADVGCGNGFLTYILLNEGYKGYGVDLTKRKSWENFSAETQGMLFERALQPHTECFDNVNWIIGNHADELTPWVTLWAARSNCKFISIPCCYHCLSGYKYTRKEENMSRYRGYCEYLRREAESVGILMEEETLRIPSTKNICLLSRTQFPDVESHEAAKNAVNDIISGVVVVTRKSDREKSYERAQLQKRRLLQRVVDYAPEFFDQDEEDWTSSLFALEG